MTAALKSGKKVVGKGSPAATNGTATLNVKISKKLKKGKYTLTVVATDGKTTTSKTVKVKVAK